MLGEWSEKRKKSAGKVKEDVRWVSEKKKEKCWEGQGGCDVSKERRKENGGKVEEDVKWVKREEIKVEDRMKKTYDE